jgi:hypothetical protein
MRTGASFVLASGNQGFGSASCNAGEKATGGGVYPVSNVYFPTVVASFPTPNDSAFTNPPRNGITPTGWDVWVTNNSTVTQNEPNSVTMIPYVICASP